MAILVLLRAIPLLIIINLVLILAEGTNDLARGQRTVEKSTGIELILSACKKREQLDFANIEEFSNFIKAFKKVSEGELREAKVADNCLRDQVAILDLGELVKTQTVCDFVQVDNLISYHKKYFKPKRFSMSSKIITKRFFTKYAIRVAYTCKKNLIQNIQLSSDELRDRSKSFEEARERVFREEPSIKSTIELIKEQPDDQMATNLKPRDEAEMTLSEYRDALTKLRRPEDILTFDRDDCKKSKQRQTTISKDRVQLFFKPSIMCLQLARYYSGSLLSIAKLANYGYVAPDDELDLLFADNKVLRAWIVAVQVCEPLLHMQAKTGGSSANAAVGIDTCSDRVASIETIAFDDNLVELDNEKLEEMILRSEATRKHAQKLMKSALRKMAKANMKKMLSSGAKKRSIFSQSFALLANSNDHTAQLGQLQRSVLTQESSWSSDLQSLSSKSSRLIENSPSLSSKKEESDSFDKESAKILMEVVASETALDDENNHEGDIDGAVGFDPMSQILGTLTVFAIMLSFEWLFFIVMTLAARVCQGFHMNFDNMLGFPPKLLSWSDADFSRLNEKIEKLDEDDLFDYDELNEAEKRQRDLLAKVFKRPPPMLFRE